MSIDKTPNNDTKERLFKAYDAKSTDLQRAFILEIAFGFFFFFMILFPYLSLRIDIGNLSPMIELTENISNIIDKIDLFIRDAHDNFTTLEKILNKSISFSETYEPYEQQIKIISYLINSSNISNTEISDVIKEKLISIPIFPHCYKYKLGSPNWTECNTRAMLIETTTKSRGESRNSLSPLSNINLRLNETISSLESFLVTSLDIKSSNPNTQDLSLRIDTINLTIESILNQLEKIENITVKLTKQISDPGNALPNLNEIKEMIKDIEKSKIEIERQKSNMQVLLDNLNNSTLKLSIGVEQLELPVVGKLPIRFEDAIAVSPIALSIGFLVCSTILCQTIQIRKNINKLYKDTGKNIDITILAPLWLEPKRKKPFQSLQFVIFLIPLIIFVVSLIIIIYLIFFIEGKLISIAPYLNLPVYLFLYFLSAFLFFISFRNINHEISKYHFNK